MPVSNNFHASALDLNGQTSLSGPTALVWGPDGRLYVTEVSGDVKVLTVEFGDKNPGDGDAALGFYVSQATALPHVKAIKNHNDDGSSGGADSKRQVTGIDVTKQFDAGGNQVFFDGKAASTIYVSSSDSRIGAGGGGADVGLDTNSGVLTKLVQTGPDSWEAIDLVRGFPRSEENHALNGLEVIQEIDAEGKLLSERLIVASGGNANSGAPSNNFAGQEEQPLSAAILEIDLDALKLLSVKIDAVSGRSYVYDLPTLDDPTRAATENDPFGGNDSLNSAKLTADGPVRIYSAGYRNSYDVEVTEDGRVWTYDNGANNKWGGRPIGEAGDNDGATDFAQDPGYIATNLNNGDEQASDDINLVDWDPSNKDNFHEVTRSDDLAGRTLSAGQGGAATYTDGTLTYVYGGHPNPTRAEGSRAGLLFSPGSGTDDAFLLVSNQDSFGNGDPDGDGDGSDYDEVIDWLAAVEADDARYPTSGVFGAEAGDLTRKVLAVTPGVAYDIYGFSDGSGAAVETGGPAPQKEIGGATETGALLGISGLPADIAEIVAAPNPIEGDYREAGKTDGALDSGTGSINGLAEYTSTVLDGNGVKMSGAIIAADFNGELIVMGRGADGLMSSTTSGGFSVAADRTIIDAAGKPLGLAALGDDFGDRGLTQPFQGSIWAATYQQSTTKIEIFQPNNGAVPLAGSELVDETDQDLDGVDNVNDPFEFSPDNGYALAGGEKLVLDFVLIEGAFPQSLNGSGLLGAALDGETPNQDARTEAELFPPDLRRDGLFDDGGNLIIGANAPKVQIKKVAAGTVVGEANTARDALHTGVKPGPDVTRLVATLGAENWIPGNSGAAEGQVAGMMFGDGTQKNFVRLVYGGVDDTGAPGFEVGYEIDDVYVSLARVSEPGLSSAAVATLELRLEIDMDDAFALTAGYRLEGEAAFTDIDLGGFALPAGVLRNVLTGAHAIADQDATLASGAAIGLVAETVDGAAFGVDFTQLSVEAFGNEIEASDAAGVAQPGTSGEDRVIYDGTDTELALAADVENFDGSASIADFSITANDLDNEIVVGPGANTIATVGGADVVRGIAADFDGDEITDFSTDDAVIVEGADASDFRVVAGDGSARVVIDGQAAITFSGSAFAEVTAADDLDVFTFEQTSEGVRVGMEPPLSPVIAINAGGPEALGQTVRGQLVDFKSNLSSTGDGFGVTGSFKTHSNAASLSHDFPNTELDQVHAYERSSGSTGKWGYSIAVEDGEYLVDLIFAEIYHGLKTTDDPDDKRKFDVFIEDQQVEDDFDIIDDAGAAGVEVIKSYRVTVADGQLDIELQKAVDQAKLSGLVVWKVGGGFEPLDETAPVIASIAVENLQGDQDSDRVAQIVATDETGFDLATLEALDGSELVFSGIVPDAVSAPAVTLSPDGKTATLAYTLTPPNGSWPSGFGEISVADGVFADAAGNGAAGATAAFVVEPNLAGLVKGGVAFAVNVGSTDPGAPFLGGAIEDDPLISEAGGQLVDLQADDESYYSPGTKTANNYDGGAGNPANDPALDGSAYHTYRDATASSWTATYPVANGVYVVELHFAELYWTEDGKRVGDYSVNGEILALNFDAHKAAGGGDAPTTLARTVAVTDGKIEIGVSADAGQPGFNAIVVYDAIPADLPPTISIADVSAVEGGPATIVFSRAGDLGEAVTVSFSLAPGSAAADDYEAPAATTVIIPAGAAEATVTIDIVDDADEEAAESFTVTIDGVANASGDAVVAGGGGVATVAIAASDASLQVPPGGVIFELDFETAGEPLNEGGFDGLLGGPGAHEPAKAAVAGGALVVQTSDGDISQGGTASKNDFTRSVDLSDPSLEQIFVTTRFANPFTEAVLAANGVTDGSVPNYAQQGVVFGTGDQDDAEQVKLVFGGVANGVGAQLWSKKGDLDQKVKLAAMLESGKTLADVAEIELSLRIDKAAGAVAQIVTLFDAGGAIIGGARPEPTAGFATAAPAAAAQPVIDNLVSTTEPTQVGVTSSDYGPDADDFASFEAAWDFLRVSSPQFVDGAPPADAAFGVAQGDFSDDGLDPTDLAPLALGDNVIVAMQQGDLEPGGRDRDYVTITVPAGMTLDQIVLQGFETDEAGLPQAFLGLQAGDQVTVDPVTQENAGDLLGGLVYNSGDVGGDIMPDLAAGETEGVSFQGFTPPLPAGTYTLWFNQGGAPSTATLNLVTSEAPADGPILISIADAAPTTETGDADATALAFALSASGGFTGDAVIDIAVNGAAATPVTVSFTGGAASFAVDVANDDVDDGAETVTVALTGVADANGDDFEIDAAAASATGEVAEDDAESGGPALGALVFAVNAGGGEVVDESGATFEADAKASWSGSSSYADGKDGADEALADGDYTGDGATDGDDLVYATERFGGKSGGAPMVFVREGLTPGDYVLRLKFAELYDPIASGGSRSFDVTANGTLVVDDLDLVARAGLHGAYDVDAPVTIGADGKLTISAAASADNAKINAIAMFETAGSDAAPTAGPAIAAQAADEDAPFSFALPADAFADDGGVENLTFVATLADGADLPAWLSFDGATFSGTPADADVGALSLKVTATDAGGRSAAQVFDLAVNNANDAPTLAGGPTPDQTAQLGEPFALTLDAGLFADIDLDSGDAVTLGAAGLPAGVSFDPAAGAFSGAPTETGTFTVTVTATDLAGESVSDSFELTVSEDAAPAVVRIQAEDYDSAQTYRAQTQSAADGNQVIFLPWQSSGSATYDLSGKIAPGVYTVAIAHFDENDGASDLDFTIASSDGAAYQNGFSLTDDATSGSAAQASSFRVKTFADVEIGADAVLTINGVAKGGEYVRVDYVEFTRIGDGAGGSDNGAPFAPFGVDDQTVDENAAFTLDLSALFVDPDEDPLTFAVSGPDWLSLTDGVLSGTPGAGDVGVETVSVTADDGTDATTAAFQLTVANVNEAPTADRIPNQVAPAGAAFDFDVRTAFSDPDQDPLAFTVEGELPPGVSFADGVFSGTPSAPGAYQVTVTATDPGAEAVSRTFFLNVVGGDDRSAIRIEAEDFTSSDGFFAETPSSYEVIRLIGGGTGTATYELDGLGAEGAYDVRVVFFDEADGVSSTTLSAKADGTAEFAELGSWLWDKDGGGNWVQASNIRTLTFPGIVVGAGAALKIEAKAHNGEFARIDYIELVPAEDGGNFAPQVANGVDDIAWAGLTKISIDLDALGAFGDPEEDPLTYAKVSGPDWLTLDGGVLSGAPAEAGAFDVTVSATDGPDKSGATAQTSFTITVSDDNLPPVLVAPLGAITIAEDELLEIGVAFSDPEGGALSYALAEGAPAWLSIDPDFGFLFGMPGDADVGQTSITVTAADNRGATASETISLTVENVNDAPEAQAALADQTAAVGQAFAYALPDGAFTDADAGDALVYSAALANGDPLPAWLSIDSATGALSGTPDAEADLDVVVTATDLEGASASTGMSISVSPEPDTREPVDIEAEDFTGLASSTFRINDILSASGGKIIRLLQNESAEADTDLSEFAGGAYRLGVTFIDETDGVGGASVLVDGVEIGAWSFDGQTGAQLHPGEATGGWAQLGNYRYVEFDTPFLVEPGSTLTLRAQSEGGEFARIDSVRLIPTAVPVNAAPGVSLANAAAELPESLDTASPVKVADIVVADDGLGTNALSLAGDDAGLFEIVGAELFLKAGATLDFENNPQLDVTVAVDDPDVGATPDATAALAIAVTEVAENQAPLAVTLTQTLASLPEDADTATALKVADIAVSDDGLGVNVLSLSGEDAALFEIVGTELFLKAGAALDVAANPALDVTVAVDDAAVGAAPDASATLTVAVEAAGGGSGGNLFAPDGDLDDDGEPNLFDDDVDGDQLANGDDPFAYDSALEDGGHGVTLAAGEVVRLDFDVDGTPYMNGFTGVMASNQAAFTDEDTGAGSVANGKLTIATTAGDTGNSNNPQNDYQFGVRNSAFTLEGMFDNPYFGTGETPDNFEQLGLQLSVDSGAFMKLVFGSPGAGLEFSQSSGAQDKPAYPNGLTAADFAKVKLELAVETTGATSSGAATATFFDAAGAIVGGPVALAAQTLVPGLAAAVQDPDQAVGVGVTSTHTGGDAFVWSMDYFEVAEPSASSGNAAPTLTGPGAVEVDENSTFVAAFAASDANPGDTLAFGLAGADAALFEISATGALSFKEAPDFEALGGDAAFDVTVTLTDGVETVSQPVAVTVADVADETGGGGDPFAPDGDLDGDGALNASDPDIDGDGVANAADPFYYDDATDADGHGTPLVDGETIRLDFDADGTPFQNGLTGVMAGTSTASGYVKDTGAGQVANGQLVVPTTGGDTGGQNNPQDDYHFGVKRGGGFTVETVIENPFGSQPKTSFQQLGLAVSLDSEDFLKFVAGNVGGDFEFSYRNNDSETKKTVSLPAGWTLFGSGSGNVVEKLKLTVSVAVDANGDATATAAATVLDAAGQPVGASPAIPAALDLAGDLEAALADPAQAVGVGVTHTKGAAPAFDARFDYLEVTADDAPPAPEPTEAIALLEAQSDLDTGQSYGSGAVGSAELRIMQGQNNVAASNFGSNSFKVENTGDKKIAGIVIDVRDALYPDVVFDPDGKGGDSAGKATDIDSAGGTGVYFDGTGYVFPGPDPLPNDTGTGKSSNGGFKGVMLKFDPSNSGGFQTDETVGWSVDMDPNSIAGLDKNGGSGVDSGAILGWDVGGVSAHEMIGSNFVVMFDDGSTATGRLVSDDSQAGGHALATQAGATETVGLAVNGVSPGGDGTYGGTTPSVLVTGDPGETVRVTMTKGFNPVTNDTNGVADLVADRLADDVFKANNAFDSQTVDVVIPAGGVFDASGLFDYDDLDPNNGKGDFAGDDTSPIGFVAAAIDPATKLPKGPTTKPIYLANEGGPVTGDSTGGGSGVDGYYLAEGGRVKVQLEDVAGGANPPSGWVHQDASNGDNPGFQGDGYYYWKEETGSTGIDSSASDGIITATIYIQEAGTYDLRVRSARDTNKPGDARNDIWVKVDDGTKALTPGQPDLVTSNGYAKLFGAGTDWGFATNFDAHDTKPSARVELDIGFHTIAFAGRSDGFHIDFFELYKGSAPSPGAPNSAFVEGDSPPDSGNAAPSITSTDVASVTEGQTAAFDVDATDADGDTLVFSIAGGADADAFTIDAASGAVSFKSAPDFEAPADAGGDNVYDLTVAATDGEATATQAVAVSVANDPSDDGGSGGGAGGFVASVVANDDDVEEGSRLNSPDLEVGRYVVGLRFTVPSGVSLSAGDQIASATVSFTVEGSDGDAAAVTFSVASEVNGPDFGSVTDRDYLPETATWQVADPWLEGERITADVDLAPQLNALIAQGGLSAGDVITVKLEGSGAVRELVAAGGGREAASLAVELADAGGSTAPGGGEAPAAMTFTVAPVGSKDPSAAPVGVYEGDAEISGFDVASPGEGAYHALTFDFAGSAYSLSSSEDFVDLARQFAEDGDADTQVFVGVEGATTLVFDRAADGGIVNAARITHDEDLGYDEMRAAGALDLDELL